MSNPVAIHTGANWKNVNNWHWIEKDCTAWAHDRIKVMFTACPDLPTDFSITKVTKIEGDVSVNQRKGRVKQLFDLEISFEYKLAAGETGTGFVTEFTADYEDPTDLCLKLTPRIEGKEQQDAILRAVGKLAEEFKKELYEVHGKPLLLEASEANSEARSADKPAVTISNANTSATMFASSTAATASISTPSSSASASIEDEVTFPCPPDQLYLMLTDSGRMSAWSRAPVTPQIILPQAHFTLFDGNICGKFLTLKSPSQIEMEWKLRSWAKLSVVCIEIKEAENGGCKLKIKQTGVPSGEAETVKSNWHNYYWNPIKRAFGVLL